MTGVHIQGRNARAEPTGATSVKGGMCGPRSRAAGAPDRIRDRGPDAFLLYKCKEARRVGESSRTVHEGLYDAYRHHLHWIDSAHLPEETRKKLRALRECLCRYPDSVCVTSADIRVRHLDRSRAEHLLRRLIELCLEIEALATKQDAGERESAGGGETG